jgi:hypothetical protein
VITRARERTATYGDLTQHIAIAALRQAFAVPSFACVPFEGGGFVWVCINGERMNTPHETGRTPANGTQAKAETTEPAGRDGQGGETSNGKNITGHVPTAKTREEQ